MTDEENEQLVQIVREMLEAFEMREMLEQDVTPWGNYGVLPEVDPYLEEVAAYVSANPGASVWTPSISYPGRPLSSAGSAPID